MKAGASRSIRVLIVDDSRDFLDAASDWIERQPGMELCGTAMNGADGLGAIETVRPDLVLMDAFMPELDGFEATRRAKSVAGAPWIVILSFHHGAAIEREAWAAGADAFVPKGELSDQLPSLVERLVAGETPDDPTRPRPGRASGAASASRGADGANAPVERREIQKRSSIVLGFQRLASILGRSAFFGWRRRRFDEV